MDQHSVTRVIGYTLTLIIVLFTSSTGAATTVNINGPSEVFEGTTVKLTCSASCGGNETCNKYTWSGGASGSSATLNTEVRRNKSNFTCTVNGVSKTKSITVFYGPDNITISNGSSVTVREGDTQSSKNILCAASGYHPDVNITWTSSNTQFVSRNATGDNVWAYASGTNDIFKPEHAGTYTCTAFNTKNSESRKQASTKLIVHYAATPTIRWEPSSKTLMCTATGNPESFNFTTTFEHKVGTVTVRFVDTSTSNNVATVALAPATYQDTGTYICRVSNGIENYRTNNKWKEESTIVKISDSPKIITGVTKGSYNVSKGDRLRVLVKYYAHPVVPHSGVTLYINDTPLVSPAFQISTTSQHVITKFHGKDVTVNGAEILIEANETLEEYFTNFTVIVTNAMGDGSVNFVVNPEGPPDTPSLFGKSEVDHSSVQFHATTGFFNGASQVFVIEHIKEEARTNNSAWNNGTVTPAGVRKGTRIAHMTVGSLEPEMRYAFRIYAYNIYGRSMPSREITVTTEKEPLNGVVIGGAVGGSIAGIIIVVVIILIILRYKRYQDSKSPPPPVVPFSEIIKGQDVPYENTVLCNKNNTPTTPEAHQIYENTMLDGGLKPQTATKPSTESTYVNRNDMTDAIPSDSQGYIVLTDEPHVEEAYGNVDVKPHDGHYYNAGGAMASPDGADKGPLPGTSKESTGDGTGQYINWQKHKLQKQDSEGLYLQMDKVDSQSATNLYYNQKNLASKEESGSNRDTYMAMSKPRGSVPEYNAPLPPGVFHQEENYMNTEFASRKS